MTDPAVPEDQPTRQQVSARERRFYLEQFSGHTLVVAHGDEVHADTVERCVADLVAEDVRVVLLRPAGAGGPGGPAQAAVDSPVTAHSWRPDDEGVVAVWRQLQDTGRMEVALPQGTDVMTTATALAVRLRAFKLVLVSAAQRRPDDVTRPDSFLTLTAGEGSGEGPRAVAARALAGGVSTVNLCHPADIAEELLTYAGAGTCFTLGSYTSVERLGIDDFPQVAELIQRGVEEGYLKARDPDAVARLVVNGYGARVGGHHLAGFASLLTEPYVAQRMGELSALTTISRFAGGGVGAQLVDRMLADAASAGLLGVFACTTAEAAARFFRRLGFIEVPQAELPAAKWEGYDPTRRPQVRAFLHHLTMVGP